MPPPGTVAAPLPAPLTVRLVRAEERARWQQRLAQHHYLPGARMVGEALWYVATAGVEWVALLAWAAAALKCRPRDAWIGWRPPLQWRRLRFVVNNVRFCCLPPARPNLASQVLALNLRRLSADWERAYGQPVLLAETFVDPTRFRGTCYRAAGWACLGTTRGFAKQNTRYVAHGTPKTVWVRSLRPGAALSVDGQPLRGGHARGQAAPHLLSAILRQDAGVVAQATVPATTNEIPVLPTLLRPLPLAGTIVTADALHTQVETARLLVEEKHADYVFRVKANQATLRDDIATLRLDAFPPAGHDPRDGAGAAGDPRALGQHGPERVPRVPPCRAGLLPAAHRGPRDPDHAD